MKLEKWTIMKIGFLPSEDVLGVLLPFLHDLVVVVSTDAGDAHGEASVVVCAFSPVPVARRCVLNGSNPVHQGEELEAVD